MFKNKKKKLSKTVCAVTKRSGVVLCAGNSSILMLVCLASDYITQEH